MGNGLARVGRLRAASAALAASFGLALIGAGSAAAAPPYPEAVLLVSGYETETPFTTPAPQCVGAEDEEWNPPGGNGVAPILKAAGRDVFTAQITRSGDPIPPPCTGPGEPKPAANTAIISNGATDSNGAALARLIALLRDGYGVEKLHIVAHSDGGLWSRAAITQNVAYDGLTIESLTTLGTPHTGSFVADLGMELVNGKCQFSNRIEQDICQSLEDVIDLVFDELGPVASRELTNDFLATWNPQQTIGSCPVSGIAGDHVGFDIPFLEYYTPSDGLVGLASAQAKEALDFDGKLIPGPGIPDFREAGVYDVVHSLSLGFIDKNNLLNQRAISEQVEQNTLLSGAEACNVPDAPDGADGAGAEASVGDLARIVRLRGPLYRMVAANRRGRLPRPGPEDFAVSRKRVRIGCGFQRLEPIPLLGDRRVRIHATDRCDERLRASGRGEALLLRSHPRRHVVMRLLGDQVRIRIRGRQPRRWVAQVADGGRWQRLALNRAGRGTLPETNALRQRLRVRARGHAKRRIIDIANFTIAR